MKLLARHLILLCGLLPSVHAWSEETRPLDPAPIRDAAADGMRPTPGVRLGDNAGAGSLPVDAPAVASTANPADDAKGGDAVAARRERAAQDPFFLLLLQILRTPK